jgi:uncharacterized DUF497 family protein
LFLVGERELIHRVFKILVSISVFADELARLIPDPDNSEGAEQGVSSHYNFLTVYHCERNASTIRIISARKADKLERNSMRATVMRESYDFGSSRFRGVHTTCSAL